MVGFVNSISKSLKKDKEKNKNEFSRFLTKIEGKRKNKFFLNNKKIPKSVWRQLSSKTNGLLKKRRTSFEKLDLGMYEDKKLIDSLMKKVDIIKNNL